MPGKRYNWQQFIGDTYNSYEGDVWRIERAIYKFGITSPQNTLEYVA